MNSLVMDDKSHTWLEPRIRTLFKVYNIDDPTKGYLVPQTEGLLCTTKSLKHT